MQQLFSQLGIDWRLLISQAANFLILLVLLTFFVYKPLLKILTERKTKIQEGLEKAKEAETRLQEIALIGKKKLQEAEGSALQILREAELKAKTAESTLLAEAKRKERELFVNTELVIQSKREEARAEIRKEAIRLVKNAIAKTADLSPEQIDEALIKKALQEIKTA